MESLGILVGPFWDVEAIFGGLNPKPYKPPTLSNPSCRPPEQRSACQVSGSVNYKGLKELDRGSYDEFSYGP